MTADKNNDSSWDCKHCKKSIVDAKGTWRFPVFHVEELLKPILEEESRHGTAFCSYECIANYYLQKCPLLYLMIVGNDRKWMSLYDAGVTYDAGFVRVEIGGFVRQGGHERPITQEERQKMADIADDYSASK